MTDETLGQRVQRLRKNLDLTHDSLGELANLSGRTTRGIELGRISPQSDDLRRLAISLQVPVEYLRDGDGNEIARFAVDEFEDYHRATDFIQHANEKLSFTSFRNQQLTRDDLLRLKLEFLRSNEFDAGIEEEMEIFRLPKDDA